MANPSAATSEHLAHPQNPPVAVIDTPEVRVHRSSDLLSIVLAALGVVLILLAGVYAHGTTVGIGEDVQGFNNLLRKILFFPVSLLETLFVLVVPIAVIGELAIRRQVRMVFEVLITWALGLAAAFGAVWLIQKFGSDALIDSLSVTVRGERVLTFPIYSTGIVALLSAAGPRARRRSVRWSWVLIWVGMAVTAISGQTALTAVLVSLLTGRIVGLGVRYISGTRPERAYGNELVEAVRRTGIDPVRLVRIPDSEASTATRNQPEVDAASLAIAAHGDIRLYAVITAEGQRLNAVVLDGDRTVAGAVRRIWRALRLRGLEGRTVVSLRQLGERTALLSYAAQAAGLNSPKLLGIGEASDSIVLVYRHSPAVTSLTELYRDSLSDETVDKLWVELDRAHRHGLAHRAISAETVLITDQTKDPILIGWDNGDVASSYLARQLDLVQLLVLLSVHIGPNRAVASAVKALGKDGLYSLAPLVQTIALPASTREQVKAEKGLLSRLHSEIMSYLPESPPQGTESLERFGLRTVFSIVITLVAVGVVLATMNFDEIGSALRSAQPWWSAVAYGLGILTFVGATMTLLAFSPIKLPKREAFEVQLAGSFIALAMPAGVGPAALNLRVLTRRGVSNTLAVATVALIQVVQFMVTILLVVVLSVVTGDHGALQALPSNTVLTTVGLAVLLIAATMVIPPVRQWVAKKTMPTVRQTWPRLVDVLGKPKHLLIGLGGALILNLSYLFAFQASMAAFNLYLPLIDVALIYLVSTMLGAVIPTPGGMGTVEAALTFGLTNAGIPLPLATSVAILFRGLTYWGRIPLGWIAMRRLRKQGLL